MAAHTGMQNQLMEEFNSIHFNETVSAYSMQGIMLNTRYIEMTKSPISQIELWTWENNTNSRQAWGGQKQREEATHFPDRTGSE